MGRFYIVLLCGLFSIMSAAASASEPVNDEVSAEECAPESHPMEEEEDEGAYLPAQDHAIAATCQSDATPKEQKQRLVLINAIISKNAFDSSKHFAKKSLLSSNRYSPQWNYEIILDFGNVAYLFPEVILHYIDDLDSLGFSWIPPVDFIHNVKYGKFHLSTDEEKKPLEKIGYLAKTEQGIIETHGGDFNIDADKYRKEKVCHLAAIGEERKVDERVLVLLKAIIAEIQRREPCEYDRERAIEGIGCFEFDLAQIP